MNSSLRLHAAVAVFTTTLAMSANGVARTGAKASAAGSPSSVTAKSATTATPATSATSKSPKRKTDTAVSPQEKGIETPLESTTAQQLARPLYEAGARAFSNRQNAKAIAYFRQAERLSPNPKLTYNIALAYEDMGDPGRALAAFLSYLRQQPSSGMRSDVVSRVRRLELALAQTGLQQLVVSSNPAGATVIVDGTARGVTPFAEELKPGTYHVKLQRHGYIEKSSTLHLQSEHAFEVRAELERLASDADPASPNLRPLTWSLLSVGAASFIGGTVFELARASARETAQRASDGSRAANASGTAGAHQLTSFALFGLGTGLLVAGGLLAMDDLSPSPASSPQQTAATRIALPCASSFCGVMAQGQF